MKKKYAFFTILLILVCVLSVSLVACNHKHKWQSEWDMDSTYHWRNCSKKNCDEQGDKAEHNFVYEQDSNNHWQVCSTCGYTTAKTAHNYAIKYHDTQCWSVCEQCGNTKDVQDHDFTPLDPFCRRCGFKKGSENLIYKLNSDKISYSLVGVNVDIDTASSKSALNPKVVVSEYYKGLPVTSIGDRVFAFTNITSVYLPKTITKIGERAFKGCKLLSEIIIPQSVTTISNGAFEECYGITIKVEAKSAQSGWSMDSWGINQFCKFPIVWDCKNNNIANDGYEYFIDKQTNIKFGIKKESVNGDYAGTAIIAMQPHNQSMLNPSGALNINGGSVSYNNLTYRITSVADYAFYQNDLITSVTLPTNVKKIGDYAFGNCTNVKTFTWTQDDYTLPDEYGIEEIGIGAFINCTNLTEFKLPKKVSVIQAGLLQGCEKLNKIVINNNVKVISKNAFNGCVELGVISFDGSVNEWNSITKEESWDADTGAYTMQFGA